MSKFHDFLKKAGVETSSYMLRFVYYQTSNVFFFRLGSKQSAIGCYTQETLDNRPVIRPTAWVHWFSLADDAWIANLSSCL